MKKHPNIVYVFADQMGAHTTGYAGDPNVRTPYLDALAAESVNVRFLAPAKPPRTTEYWSRRMFAAPKILASTSSVASPIPIAKPTGSVPASNTKPTGRRIAPRRWRTRKTLTC